MSFRFLREIDFTSSGEKYGGITDMAELQANLRMNCVSESMIDDRVPAYDDFLEERRVLMARKIEIFFKGL